MLRTDENQVRRVIAEFNADGTGSLDPRIGGRRPRRITNDDCDAIRAVVVARPRDLAEPYLRWSLSKLRRYLLIHHVVAAISKAHLRRVLIDMGTTAQRLRTWKWSNDPLYEVKKQWVLALYKAAETGVIDAAVMCFDECGPISLKPHPGGGWFPTKRPGRQWATYGRTKGVRKLLGAYDVGAERLSGRVEARSVTGAVVLEFLKDIRRRYPTGRHVYIVPDGLSAHWTPDIRAWAAANRVGLLATPTNASHLNRIECHFWAHVEFVVNDSDYPDWDTFTRVTQAYLARRNIEHHSPIRQLERSRQVA